MLERVCWMLDHFAAVQHASIRILSFCTYYVPWPGKPHVVMEELEFDMLLLVCHMAPEVNCVGLYLSI